MTTLAAIDIGSNALRLLIVRRQASRRWKVVRSERAAVRLGADVFADGRVSFQTLQRLTQALRSFRRSIDRERAELVRAVGTSALRDAHNRADVLSAVMRAAQIPIDVITGHEEAQLVCTAVHERLNLSKGRHVLIDIGGGSVQVSLVQHAALSTSDSLKLGTVRLLQLFKSASDDPQRFQKLIHNHIGSMAFNLHQRFGAKAVQSAVGTGGNFEALLDLKLQLLQRKSAPRRVSMVLTRGDLDRMYDRIAALSPRQRQRKLRLRPDRADVILPALIVIRELLHTFGFKRIRVPRVGVKEGIIVTRLRNAPNTIGASGREHGHQVEEYALQLGRRLHFEERHARQVTALSTQLFDQTKKLHKLGSDERGLLQAAALLHDVGHIVNSTGHHKHSYYIIRNCRFAGLKGREQLLVACIARYHRKAMPSLTHDFYKELRPSERSTVSALAALLRIADALDRSHLAKVKKLRFSKQRRKATLKLHARHSLLNEIWAFGSKKDLFERFYKCSLTLR